MAQLIVPAHFDPAGAPEWFRRWALIAEDPELTISMDTDHSDLGDLDQLGRPAMFALLAAGVRSRRIRGLNTETARGTRTPIAAVLARTPGVLSYKNEDENWSQLLGPIADQVSAREVANRAGDLLQAQMPSLSPSVVRMARFVFEELAANVVQHSARPETGFGVVRGHTNDRRIELAFADCGIGFRESLQRNPELRARIADDTEALRLALTPRISGTEASRTNMGVGLKMLVDFSDLLGGDLWIASGDAMLQRKTIGGQRVNTIRSITPWRGAWICLDAPVP